MTTSTYTSYDFDTIVADLKRFAKSQDEFKDFNFEGSAISAFIRLLAYNANQYAFTSNMLFNELHMDSAQQRNNVASIASFLSYVPSSRRAASMVVDIIVKPEDGSVAPSQLVMSRGTRFMAVKDGTPFTFCPETEYSAPLSLDGSYTFTNVKLLQGIWTANTFDVEGTAISTYRIPNSAVDTDTMSVSVQVSPTVVKRNTYSRYTTPHSLGSNATIYFLSQDREGYYQIEFGDDQIARRLDDGNIVAVRYMVTEGEAGNGVKGLTAVSSVSGYTNVSIVEKQERSSGGADVETIESIKKASSLGFRSGGAAVVSDDYSHITKEVYPEADDVISWGGDKATPPRYGYTYVAVKPKGSETLSAAQKADLVAQLEKYNVGSTTPIIADPTYLYLNVQSKVKYDPSLTTLDAVPLKKKIQDRLAIFSSSNLEKFGRDFDMSQMSAFIKNLDVSFLGNVTTVVYERHVKPELNFFGSYTMAFNKSVKPGSVKVTGFTVSDTDLGYTYSIVDDTKGALVLQKQKGTTVKALGAAGSVDYTTGLVNLIKFRPNGVLSDGYVKVVAESSSYDLDVKAVRGDIIKVNTVTVELEAKTNV